MVDSERALADCVGAVYEAAASGDDWLAAGERIRRLLDARSATLFLGTRSHTTRNVLMAAGPGEAVYAAYFRFVDPYVARAGRDFAEARVHHLGRAKTGSELVPDASFVRSEYYSDFARRNERRHMIGGMLGVSAATPIGLYRGEDSDPFGAPEVSLLEAPAA